MKRTLLNLRRWRFVVLVTATSWRDWNVGVAVLPVCVQLGATPWMHLSVAWCGPWGYDVVGLGPRDASSADQNGGWVWARWPFYRSHWRRL